jgi:hypothetical protein
MTSPTLTDLAERVEKLTGPCRETDGLIFKALEQREEDMWTTFGDDEVWHRQDPQDHCAFDAPPAYTASLDAAMTLVPEGVWYCLSGPHSESGGRYRGGPQRFDMTMGIGEDRADGKAASAPNATVAAALRLRARAASESSHG